MSLRVSRGDLRALSGALTEISAGVSKIGSLSRVPRRCICGHMWTLNSLFLSYCFIAFYASSCNSYLGLRRKEELLLVNIDQVVYAKL